MVFLGGSFSFLFFFLSFFFSDNEALRNVIFQQQDQQVCEIQRKPFLTKTGEVIPIVEATSLLVGARDVHVTLVSQSVDVALARGPPNFDEVSLASIGDLVQDFKQFTFTPRPSLRSESRENS